VCLEQTYRHRPSQDVVTVETNRDGAAFLEHRADAVLDGWREGREGT